MNNRLPPRIMYALGCALALSMHSLTPRSTCAQRTETAANARTGEVQSGSATPETAGVRSDEVASPSTTFAPADAERTGAGDSASSSARNPDAPSRNTASAQSASAQPSEHTRVININTATAAELERLPRIGPARAQAILALRAKLTRFSKVEQLLRVKGIGRATFRKLRPMLTLEGPTTLPERIAR